MNITTDNSAVIAGLNKRIAELEAAIGKHKAEIYKKMSFKKFPSHCVEDTKLWKVLT